MGACACIAFVSGARIVVVALRVRSAAHAGWCCYSLLLAYSAATDSIARAGGSVGRRYSSAAAGHAHIVCTLIAFISAGCAVSRWKMFTSSGVAEVICALIAVIFTSCAVGRSRVGAGSARADVGGADIAVIRAGVVVVGEDATGCCIAVVIGTRIVIVTYEGCSGLTCSGRASIACSTGIAVAA